MCSLTVECVLLGVQDARLEEHGQRELRRGVCVCAYRMCVLLLQNTNDLVCIR